MNPREINDFYTPLEKYKLVNNKITSEIILKPNCNPKTQIEELKEFSKRHNLKQTWVSPLTPFIWPIFISYILLIFLFSFDLLSNLGIFASFFI